MEIRIKAKKVFLTFLIWCEKKVTIWFIEPPKWNLIDVSSSFPWVIIGEDKEERFICLLGVPFVPHENRYHQTDK